MNLIAHRRNTLAQLHNTQRKYGVEVDIRSSGNSLIIHHDPFTLGCDFDEWIDSYAHGTLILNVKEEGLENRLLKIMHEKDIKDFFFLDQSYPFLVKWSSVGERRCAVRVSEFESLENAMALAGKIDWVWVDCFTHFPLKKGEDKLLKDAGFKLCLVSPELQGRNAKLEIPAMYEILLQMNINADAICTKHPELWENLGINNE